jgi:hypothetical protein
VGGLEHAWYVSLCRFDEPPNFVTMYLVSPWCIFLSGLGH